MKLSTKGDLQCKHCGFTKSKLDLYCYFACDGYWSDLRHIAPNQAVPALVQHCPKCNRYYYISAEGVEIFNTSDYNWIEPVDYDAILPSVSEYDKFDLDIIVEYNQRLRLMWAYNDKFYRESSSSEPTEYDKTIAKNNLLRLAEISKSNPYIIIECLREAQMYEESINIATEISSEGVTRDLINRVVSFAKQNDSKPFPIELEGLFYDTII